MEVSKIQLNETVLDIKDMVARDRVNEVEESLKKRYLFLGDSYNYWGGGWLNGVVHSLDIKDENYYNYTVSGHGFCDPANLWIDDVRRFCNDYPEAKNVITDLVIVGGINDAFNEYLSNTLPNRINEFFTYVKQNLVNATVTMIFVGGLKLGGNGLVGRTNESLINCIGTERRLFLMNGGNFCYGTENALYSYSFFAPDGIHPIEAAQLASVIPAVISGLKNIPYTPSISNTQATSIGTFIETIDNGFNKLECRSVLLNSGVTITTDWTTVATLPGSIFGNTHSRKKCVMSVLTSTGNTVHHCICRIERGNIQLAVDMASTSSSYPTIATNSSTVIPFIEFNDPIPYTT